MDGRTDRQTDKIAISISRVSVLTRDKNHLRTTCTCLAMTSKVESCRGGMLSSRWHHFDLVSFDLTKKSFIFRSLYGFI